MKKILLLAASAVIFGAEIANACSCLVREPQEYFESANAVFSGRVIDVIEPGRRSDRSNPNSTNRRVRIEVSEVWKGNKARQVILTTSDSSASCGFNFVEGEDYLVYASRSEGRLTTNLCSGTKSLVQAQADLAMLNQQEIPTSNVPFENIKQDWNSGLEEPFATVVKGNEDWKKLWIALHSIYFPLNLPATEVNFTENMVIGVGLGSRPTSGYSVEIKEINVEEDKLVVNSVERQPGANCVTAQATSQPYHVVVVKRSDLPVQFNRTTEVFDCNLQ
ncbi:MULTISPECIES: protease complex subunit PrcB family protein [unclassified Coleofasciculus]|uniref:protease complex subunit PrcB family protein n=1 Tax=unclassified Coleofasciculus TaxID=2692782 RepID=UPI001881EC9F|nr:MULTISPECIES: protease complex subunit PrcB family protein [unclassified Coleofasciculus]MBE9129514.1 protease complex subunit PrcB family protein [Coleofasciculus sp. LEGE 07081]MBE9151872.1 protease complex subunit PrcB family protein [Coleofasciculus sp. LEGE 07092]